MLRRLYWILYTVAAACASCAGVQRAADEAGEKGTAVAGGLGLGFLAWLVHPVGWIGAALAAVGGALGALLVAGGDTTIHEAPSSPWPPIVALVLLVLLARSWAHWLPPLLEVLKNTAKGTPRALLGGRPKQAGKPNRFARRSD